QRLSSLRVSRSLRVVHVRLKLLDGVFGGLADVFIAIADQGLQNWQGLLRIEVTQPIDGRFANLFGLIGGRARGQDGGFLVVAALDVIERIENLDPQVGVFLHLENPTQRGDGRDRIEIAQFVDELDAGRKIRVGNVGAFQLGGLLRNVHARWNYRLRRGRGRRGRFRGGDGRRRRRDGLGHLNCLVGYRLRWLGFPFRLRLLFGASG